MTYYRIIKQTLKPVFQGEFDSSPGHNTLKFLPSGIAINGISIWIKILAGIVIETKVN